MRTSRCFLVLSVFSEAALPKFEGAYTAAFGIVRQDSHRPGPVDRARTLHIAGTKATMMLASGPIVKATGFDARFNASGEEMC
jgi:hypothetical protein